MKKKSPIILSLVLIIIFTFLLSCCDISSSPPSNTTPTDQNDHDKKIELLESQILLLIQAQTSSKEEYQSKLEKLEKELQNIKSSSDSSTNDNTHPSPPDTPESVATFTYTLSAEGNAIITGYTGDDETLVFPTSIDGHCVTEIADSAIACTSKEIIIPETITKIGWFAFSECTKLKSITIPQSVTKIGYSAFGNNRSVTIYCERNSFAQGYAESYGISYILI
jgi:hypothetical protein